MRHTQTRRSAAKVICCLWTYIPTRTTFALVCLYFTIRRARSEFDNMLHAMLNGRCWNCWAFCDLRCFHGNRFIRMQCNNFRSINSFWENYNWLEYVSCTARCLLRCTRIQLVWRQSVDIGMEISVNIVKNAIATTHQHMAQQGDHAHVWL